MKIAVMTFDALNELDSFVTAALRDRFGDRGWGADITAPTDHVTSTNEVVVEADAVIFGSGMTTDQLAADLAMLKRMTVDPVRQWLVDQCFGSLILASLGLFRGEPVCTDLMTEPLLRRQSLNVANAAFHAHGNVAMAGGCLASHYVPAWIIGRVLGADDASAMIGAAAPVDQQGDDVRRALDTVAVVLPAQAGVRTAA